MLNSATPRYSQGGISFMAAPAPAHATHSQQAPSRAFVYRHLFTFVAVVSILFVVFTTLAMLLYPGGTPLTARTHGYEFFVNFLSDLGQTRTQSGALNYPSMVLFTTAMTVVGIGLGVYFVAFARFFAGRSAPVWMKRFAWAAAAFGILAGICFVGVGATPHNLFTAVHNTFAAWAFRFLLAAAVLEIPALRLSRGIPAAVLWVNLSFIGVLAVYLLLGVLGPSHGTLIGEEIQVGGQKIIAYAAILAVFARSLLVRSQIRQLAPAYV